MKKKILDMKAKLFNLAIYGTTFFAGSLVVSSGVYAQAPGIGMQKSLGGSLSEKAFGGQQTSDGGYILSGYTSSNVSGDVSVNHGGTDAWVAKISSTGVLAWQKTMGGPGNEAANFIKQTSDSGYILAGYTTMTGGDVTMTHGMNDFWIVKLTATGSISWRQSMGGADVENAYSIRETYDGGYVVTGMTFSLGGDITSNHGSADVWVVKISGVGSLEWQKTYGGTAADYGHDIVQTTDTGYLITGYSYSSNGDLTTNHGNSDIWVLKIDKAGAVQWQKSMGGSLSEYGYSCAQLTDGNYVVAGSTYSSDGDVTAQKGIADYWIIKFSQTGSVLWQKTFGGSNEEEARSIIETAGGGCIVSGYSNSNDTDVSGNHGSLDIWVLKLSSTGAIQWQKSCGGTGIDEGYCMSKTADGGYFLVGSSQSNNGDATANAGNYDFWAVKLDACTPSTPTIVLSGTTLSTSVAFDSYQWMLTGSPIAGATNATYVATLNGDYTVAVTNTYGCPATSAIQTVTSIGVGFNNVTMTDGIMVFPNPSNGSFTINLPETQNTMAITIIDLFGNTVAISTISPNQPRTTSFSMTNVPSGNYLIKVTDGETIYRNKLTVIK